MSRIIVIKFSFGFDHIHNILGGNCNLLLQVDISFSIVDVIESAGNNISLFSSNLSLLILYIFVADYDFSHSIGDKIIAILVVF